MSTNVPNPKFQIYKGKNEKFYFRLNAKNGQQILASQGYASKASCKNGIESVQKNGGDSNNFEVKTSKDGKHYFNLLAANKQVIGTSQMYASADSCQKGIASVGNNAPGAPVEDQTVEG